MYVGLFQSTYIVLVILYMMMEAFPCTFVSIRMSFTLRLFVKLFIVHIFAILEFSIQ